MYYTIAIYNKIIDALGDLAYIQSKSTEKTM